jgi:hypothetical protein
MHNVANYRKYLLNGIAWIAGLEVPADGVNAPPPPADNPPIPVSQPSRRMPGAAPGG